MEITIKRTVTPKTICGAFTGCFEGGYSPWIRETNLLKGQRDPNENVVWWAHESVYANPFKIELVYDREEDNEGEGKGFMILTPAKVKAGLQVLATEYPQIFGRIMDEEGDALDDDAFVQCCVFGKLVYG